MRTVTEGEKIGEKKDGVEKSIGEGFEHGFDLIVGEIGEGYWCLTRSRLKVSDG